MCVFLAGMVLTMADASLAQQTGIGAVSTCRTDIYGPKVCVM